MRYVMFYTSSNYETGKVSVGRDEYSDFEDMMKEFTLVSAAKESVLVIEPDMKKVVAHYRAEGKVTFNKVLLDGTIFISESEEGD